MYPKKIVIHPPTRPPELHTGTDFLYWLRTMKRMTSIPVVMFSGSPGTLNVAKCYTAGANHFITKPKDLERLKEVVRALHLSFASDKSDPTHILHLPEYQPDPRKRARVSATP